MDIASVKRVGPFYLEREGNSIEVALIDFGRGKALFARLSEWSSEDFFIAFGELLAELYEGEYRKEEREVKALRERIEELKAKGYDTKPEEADLRRHENERAKYAKKYDILKFALEEFKKVLGR